MGLRAALAAAILLWPAAGATAEEDDHVCLMQQPWTDMIMKPPPTEEEIEFERATMQRQLKKFKRQEKDDAINFTKLQQEQDQLKHANSKLTSERDHLASNNEKLKVATAAAVKTLEELKGLKALEANQSKEWTKVQEDHKKVSALLNTTLAKQPELMTQVSQLAVQKRELGRAIEALKAHQQELTADFNQIKDDSGSVGEKLKHSNAELANNITRIMFRHRELAKNSSDVQQTIDQLTNEISRIQGESQHTDAENQQLQAVASKMTSDANQIREDNENLKSFIAKVQFAIQPVA